MSDISPFCNAFLLVPTEEGAKKIARDLITSNMAGCVNIVPGVTSMYIWEETLRENSELILMIKTRYSRMEEITEFINKNHPYVINDTITTPITGGNPAFIKWLGDTVKEKA